MSVWPNFFVVGAPRAGTTTLNEVLDAHPRVFMSQNKEPWYYAVADRTVPYSGPGDGGGVMDRVAYQQLFKDADGFEAVGEASTLYLQSEFAVERIAAEVPHARIIVTLRDPALRAFSNYSQHRWQAREDLEFRPALDAGPERIAGGWAPFWDYEGLSRYGAQLERWLQAFPRPQVHVILFDDLVADRARTIRGLYEFLDVDAEFLPEDPGAVNASGEPKSARLHAFLRGSSGAKRVLRAAIPQRVRSSVRAGVDKRNASKAELSAEDRAVLVERLGDDLALAGRLLDMDLVGRWFS